VKSDKSVVDDERGSDAGSREHGTEVPGAWGDGGRRGERRDSWDDLNKAMERGIVVLMCCWEAKCGEEGSRAVVGRGSERHLEWVVCIWAKVLL
jgi:hypothetical protein